MNIYLLKINLITCLALNTFFISPLRAQIQQPPKVDFSPEQTPVRFLPSANEDPNISEIVYRLFPTYSELDHLDELHSWFTFQAIQPTEGQESSDVKALRETLSVIMKEIKFKLITTSYFSQLSNQSPWDVDQNTRNLLLGLPACAPSHKSITTPRLQLRDRQLRFKIPDALN